MDLWSRWKRILPVSDDAMFSAESGSNWLIIKFPLPHPLVIVKREWTPAMKATSQSFNFGICPTWRRVSSLLRAYLSVIAIRMLGLSCSTLSGLAQVALFWPHILFSNFTHIFIQAWDFWSWTYSLPESAPIFADIKQPGTGPARKWPFYILPILALSWP